METVEKRTFDCNIEIRKDDGKETKLKGHAAIFNEYVSIGGWFMERIMPGAFKQAIKQDDVRALFNHDANFILGRNVSGTLEMDEDKTGLAVDITPPDTQLVKDLVLSPIERGDISQMSFAFQVLEEKWIKGKDKELDKRDILKVKLFDVSPVTYAAYEGTDIALANRSKAFEHTEIINDNTSRKNILMRRLNLLKRRQV